MQAKAENLFVSYAHRDRAYLDRLQVHLRPLERDHHVDLWADTRLTPGSRWREQISTAIDSASVAILLISADFLASEFIVNNELPPLLAAATNRGLRVLPVVTGHCRFEQTPALCEYQAVNSPSRPLARLPVAERERIWTRVAESVEAVFQGRQLTEGWLAANERRVCDALQALIENGGNKSYLIVETADYYIQFMYYLKRSSLYCEAVSDAFLPERVQLTKKAADLLVALGFQEPKDADSNYARVLPLTEGVVRLEEVARLVVKVFSDVYSVTHNAELGFKHEYQDRE